MQQAIASNAHQSSRIACVADLDNLLHRGPKKPQYFLDVPRLITALLDRGVEHGAIIRNWDCGALAVAIWESGGFNVLSVHENCDQKVMQTARSYAANTDLEWLVLLSGDGDYCETVKALQANGVRVEVWAKRVTASRRLLKTANRFRYVDQFLSVLGATSCPGLQHAA